MRELRPTRSFNRSGLRFRATPQLLRPRLTSASRSRALRRAQSGFRTRRGPPEVRSTAFPAHPPNLPPRSLMTLDFAVTCPLVRPGRPHIRFLSIGSRFCSTLPSDPASRRRPCASLALRRHQAGQRTSTSKLSIMLGTQTKEPPRRGGSRMRRQQRSEVSASRTRRPGSAPSAWDRALPRGRAPGSSWRRPCRDRPRDSRARRARRAPRPRAPSRAGARIP